MNKKFSTTHQKKNGTFQKKNGPFKKRNDEPLKPVNITKLHMERDLIDARKAYNKFVSMGECMWAADWERYCRQISGKIAEYTKLEQRYKQNPDPKFLKWMENILRQYEHYPFKQPKNLSHVSRDRILVQVQQKYYKRPPQFQGVSA